MTNSPGIALRGSLLDPWPSLQRNRIDCQLPHRSGDYPAWEICREPHSLPVER